MAVMPCSDALSCDHEEKSAVPHSHTDDEEDTCTPFCGCQCCSITIAYPLLDKLPISYEKHAFSYSFSYMFNYTHEHAGMVWHPPLFG